MARFDRETETQIMAYVDGVMPAEDRVAFDARIAAEPDLGEAVEALRLQNAALTQLFDAEAIRMSVSRPVTVERRRLPVSTRLRHRVAVPLALAASFGLGLFVSSVLQPPAPPQPISPMNSCKLSAATYQRLFSSSTFDALPVDQAVVGAALAEIGSRLATDLSDIPTPPGLSLKRAELLEFSGKPLAQLTYQADDGSILALCIFPRANAGDVTAPGAPRDILDQTAVEWSGEAFAYLLLGNAPDLDMTRYADEFATRLQ